MDLRVRKIKPPARCWHAKELFDALGHEKEILLVSVLKCSIASPIVF